MSKASLCWRWGMVRVWPRPQGREDAHDWRLSTCKLAARRYALALLVVIFFLRTLGPSVSPTAVMKFTFFGVRRNKRPGDGIAALKRPRGSPLARFNLLQHVNAKRDSIYCKMRQWKYNWLQNATRYVISKWYLLHVMDSLLLTAKRDSFFVICRLRLGFPHVHDNG